MERLKDVECREAIRIYVDNEVRWSTRQSNTANVRFVHGPGSLHASYILTQHIAIATHSTRNTGSNSIQMRMRWPAALNQRTLNLLNSQFLHIL